MKDFVNQLENETRKVDFDSFDISVKELVSMSEEDIIDVAPEYQRQFRWPEENQSRLIYRGKPPALPEDSPRFDLCGGRGGLYGGWASTDIATEWSMTRAITVEHGTACLPRSG